MINSIPKSLMLKVARRVQQGLHDTPCELHVHPFGWFVFFDDGTASRSVCISDSLCKAFIADDDDNPVLVGAPADMDAVYNWLVAGELPAGAEA